MRGKVKDKYNVDLKIEQEIVEQVNLWKRKKGR